MSKKAGKKGTRKGRPRGARGNGSGVLAFIGGVVAGMFTAAGAGQISNGAITMIRTEKDKPAPEPLHPAVDGVITTGSGAVVTAMQAVAKPLRKHALAQLVGNAIGGVGKAVIRVITKEKPAGTGRSVAEELRRKRMREHAQNRLPQGSGQSAREQMLEAARN